MPFITKLDFSNNRQIKQYPETVTALSGATVFGLPYSYLPTGVDLTTTAITVTYSGVVSTFSGNSVITNYDWFDNGMNIAIDNFSALTPSNSGITQNSGSVFIGFTTASTLDGYNYNLTYTGISFDITPISMYSLGGGNYSGTVHTNILKFYSGLSTDFTGRTIWADISGITRTNDLIITDSPIIGHIWMCSDSEGRGSWSPSSGLTGISTYWVSGSSGNYSIKTSNDSGLDATGDYALAEGGNTLASGFASHAEGSGTTANWFFAHAEGYQTLSNSFATHAEGYKTTASGAYSHAEGYQTTANDSSSHAEGENTIASGLQSHSEGLGTTASGQASHAGGLVSIASGQTSFVHGNTSIAGGTSTIVLGDNITGFTNNTVYVGSLNIKNVGSSAFVNDLRIDGSGYLTTNTSDERLKENIKDISNALDIIKNLRGVSYEWKDKKAGGNKTRLGFIAQEVERVEPILVFTNSVDGYKGLNSDGILPLLVESVKELSKGVINGNTILQTQTIVAEDNNIELNFNGNQESAIGGGLKIYNGVGEEPATLIIDSKGNWTTNTDIIPNGIVIPIFTPSSSEDINGNIGNITRDDDYLYVKTNNGWRRSGFESF